MKEDRQVILYGRTVQIGNYDIRIPAEMTVTVTSTWLGLPFYRRTITGPCVVGGVWLRKRA